MVYSFIILEILYAVFTYSLFIDEFRAVKSDECRVVQFGQPWCEGLSPTKLRCRHETVLLAAHVLPLFASWGDVGSLVVCPGCIHGAMFCDTYVFTAFRRICRLFVEVQQLQASQISVFSHSGSSFCLTSDILIFGTALMPLLRDPVLFTGCRGDGFLNAWSCVPRDSAFGHRLQKRPNGCVGVGMVEACQPASKAACSCIEINPGISLTITNIN